MSTVAGADSARLPRLDLTGSRIRRTDLSHANLAGAILDGADLSHANLRGANLAGASLKGTILIGADLTGARNLTRAQISEARTDETTKLPEGLRSERRSRP